MTFSTCDGNGTSYSNYVWETWSTASTASTTSSATSYSPNIWKRWVSCDPYNATDSTTAVWVTWIEPIQLSGKTKEQIDEDEKTYEKRRLEAEKKQKEIEEKQKRIEEERKQAEIKSKELLLDLIGKEQADLYEKTGRLLVKGNKHDYLIKKIGGVIKVEKDKLSDLCIHLENRYAFPETDNVISLMLLAKADEEEFNRIANNHGTRHRPTDFLIEDQLKQCAVAQ